MNLDTSYNGIREVLEIKRINTEYEMCFLVRYKDWYGKIAMPEMKRADRLIRGDFT